MKLINTTPGTKYFQAKLSMNESGRSLKTSISLASITHLQKFLTVSDYHHHLQYLKYADPIVSVIPYLEFLADS